MTQTTFAPAPAFEAPEQETAPTGSRRTLLIAGGVVAALALGGGGYLLLSGGSSSEDLGAAPVHLPVAKKPVAKVPAKVVKPAVKVPPTSTTPIGRDPFRALYVAPVAAPAAAAPAGGTTTSTTTSAGGSTSSGSTTTTSSGTTTAPSAYKLTLTKVSGSGKDLTATFSVGGKLMAAKVGTVFGPTGEIKLLSLGQDAKGVWVATLQVGDDDPVDASKGETLYVK